MRNVWMFCITCLVCLTVRAGNYAKREVEKPCFVTANTSKIEIKKIILTDEHTQVDAILYGKPGEAAVISSRTCLRTPHQEFPLREAGHVSIDGKTEPELIPASGKQHIILSFAPIPRGIHSVDFVEKEEGWTVWGVQLTGAEPYVYLPSFLQNRRTDQSDKLPEPKLNPGRTIVNGYILGYDARMDVEMVFRHSDWLFANDWGQTVKIRQDGSFHIEEDLLLACGAKLQINQAQLDLFLLPGTETTVYIHLPKLSMAASRLLSHRYGKQQKAWFDGEGEALNTELATWGYPLSVANTPDFADKTAGMTAEAYADYVQSETKKIAEAVTHNKKVGEAYREYVKMNLKMSLLVLQGAKGKMPGTVNSPYFRYGYDYVDYLQYTERDKGQMLDIWEDLKKAQAIYRRLIKEQRMEHTDKKLLNSISQPEIRAYLNGKAKAIKATAERAKATKSYVIAELDTTVTGADILPAIISQHKGRAILVDFWATWCGPCRKSMHAIRPVKEKFPAKDVAYIYLAGPSSPEDTWKAAITEINGVHYRLTARQWDYLCRTYGITGVPGYLVISYDGKLQDRYVGFPGADTIEKDLLRASE